MKTSAKITVSICCFLVLLSWTTLLAQQVPHQSFIQQAITQTLASMDEYSGISLEKTDTLLMPEGYPVIQYLKIQTTAFPGAGRIYVDLKEIKTAPLQEAAISTWFGGLADMEGKVRWKVDPSTWTFKVLQPYYHPDARYIVALASVDEVYRLEELALLSPEGEIVYMTGIPDQLIFNKDRSVMAGIYNEKGPNASPMWRLRYRNLDSDQEWEQYFTGQKPVLRLVNPKDNGLIYSLGDTLVSADYFGQHQWKTHVSGLNTAWFVSGDGVHFFLSKENSPLNLLGLQAREVKYTFGAVGQETINPLYIKSIEESAYAIQVFLVKPGVRKLSLYGNGPDVLKEIVLTEGSDEQVNGYFRKEKGMIEIYNGNRLVMKWRDGDEGKKNQGGPK